MSRRAEACKGAHESVLSNWSTQDHRQEFRSLASGYW